MLNEAWKNPGLAGLRRVLVASDELWSTRGGDMLRFKQKWCGNFTTWPWYPAPPRMMIIPIIYRVFFSIPGGCLGFCPSTVWMDEWDVWFLWVLPIPLKRKLNGYVVVSLDFCQVCCLAINMSSIQERFGVFQKAAFVYFFLDASRGMIRNHRNPDPLIIQKGVS